MQRQFRQRLGQVGQGRGERVGAVIRQLADEDFIEHHAQGVEVGAAVDFQAARLLGAHVAGGADGEAGLREMITKPAHLVISDFNMPKLDGLGLLRAVRSHPPTQGAAFIMLTGRADKELVQRAVQFGVNNYLVKPFTVAQLKDKLESVFGPLT
eukprot:gene17114-biopygen14442